MAGNQAQRIALRDRGQHQLRLHHCKGVANALARSSPERNVGEARATGRTLWREAFRVERLRLLPKCRVTVGTIGADKHHAVGWNSIAANLILGCGKTGEAEG